MIKLFKYKMSTNDFLIFKQSLFISTKCVNYVIINWWKFLYTGPLMSYYYYLMNTFTCSTTNHIYHVLVTILLFKLVRPSDPVGSNAIDTKTRCSNDWMYSWGKMLSQVNLLRISVSKLIVLENIMPPGRCHCSFNKEWQL